MDILTIVIKISPKDEKKTGNKRKANMERICFKRYAKISHFRQILNADVDSANDKLDRADIRIIFFL